MRYLTGLIILIFIHSCASRNQEIVRDENGAIIYKCKLKRGVRHGKCYHYFPDGTIMVINSWVKGVRDGERIEYFENGNVMSKAMWKNGKLNGEAVDYFENGNIKITGMFIDGKQYGKFFEYFENGGKKTRSYFINNNLMFTEFYDEEGRVEKEHHYITINDRLTLNGQVIYDMDNAENYPDNVNFEETWHARIFADRDTVEYGSFVEYEVDWMCEEGTYVLAFTGNIDHNFNLIDSASMKQVDLENKNRFYPTNFKSDTLRVIFRFRKDGEVAIRSHLEEVFVVNPAR